MNSDVVTECPVDFAGQGGAPEVLNLAAYKFAALKDLNSLRRELKNLADQLGLRGTILLSPEGINLFVAGHKESVDRLIDRIHLIPGLEDLSGKQSFTSHQPFHRMLVKIKKEIIAFGIDEVRPAEWTSPKLPASELRRWLDEGRDITLLDVRNDYEIKLGTFRNAVDFGLKHFRHFPAAAADWTTSAKDKPLVMFCTGGIRCEKAGPYMEKIGFKNIFQLDGGILKYFEECGGDHYEGSCFVFDQRVAVGPDLNPTGDAICFACQATLTHEEMQSPKYEVGVSCPHCYREPDEIKKEQTMQRQALLQSIASSQPGCQPYANVRFTHVPRRLAGLALIDCLDQWHPGYGRDRWQHELEMGNLWKEGERVTSDRVVKEGERFEHRLENCVEPAVATDIRILLEEEGFIVVEKPAPLPCHPSGRYNKNTLQSFLNEVYHPQKIRLMHRLDANTSGLILAARIYKAAKNCKGSFRSCELKRSIWLACMVVP